MSFYKIKVPNYNVDMDSLIPQRLLEQKKKQTETRSQLAVAYVRVSDESQVNNESLGTQRDRIEKYAEQYGYEIVEWFIEEGRSGKTVKQRPAMLKMLKFCAKNKGKIGYAIFYKMQRASRDSTTYAAEVKLVFNSLGMSVRSATEHIDDTPSGRFMEGMFVLNGQLDNEIKSGTTTDNMETVARQGWYQGPPLPGFRLDKVKVGIKKTHTTLKRNKNTWQNVAELFETFAGGGFTQADIVRMAKEKGITNYRGKPLDDNGVHRMLTQPAYAGYICNKLTNFEMIEGQHFKEAIVTLETFQRVQLIINTTSRKRAGHTIIIENETYPLKRFVLCFNCLKPLYASSPKTGGGKSHSPRYHCARPSCRGKVPSAKADTVNKEYAELLKRVKPTDSTLRLYKEILNRTAMKQLDNLNRRLSSLRNALSALDEERSIAMRRWNKGEMSDADKDEVVMTIEADKFDKKDQIAKLEEQQAVKQSQIDYAMNFMHDAHKLWVDADVSMRRGFQNMIFPEGVILDTRTLEFGTTKISLLYRYVPNKKDLSVKEKSLVVIPRGIEPLCPG